MFKFSYWKRERWADVVGAHQNLNGSRTWPCPFQWWFAILGLAFAAVILSTKFEVSVFTRYEDMKRDTKYGKWGGLGF